MVQRRVARVRADATGAWTAAVEFLKIAPEELPGAARGLCSVPEEGRLVLDVRSGRAEARLAARRCGAPPGLVTATAYAQGACGSSAGPVSRARGRGYPSLRSTENRLVTAVRLDAHRGAR
jgi:hypothetical protein